MARTISNDPHTTTSRQQGLTKPELRAFPSSLQRAAKVLAHQIGTFTATANAAVQSVAQESSKFEQPLKLVPKEVTTLKEILAGSGLSSTAVDDYFDRLQNLPQKPGNTSAKGQQKQVQALRIMIDQYHKAVGIEDKLVQRRAVIQVQALIIKCTPKEVQIEFIKEQAQKLSDALVYAGFDEDVAKALVDKVATKGNREQLGRMISFACRHEKAHDYHPREGISLYGTFKQPIEIQKFSQLVSKPSRFNKEEQAQLKMLFKEFKQDHPRQESNRLKQHLAMLIESGFSFKECARAIQFWDQLRVGQSFHAKNPLAPVAAGNECMGRAKCHLLLLKDSQEHKTYKDIYATEFAKISNSMDTAATLEDKQYDAIHNSLGTYIKTNLDAFNNACKGSKATQETTEALTKKVLEFMGQNPAAAMRLVRTIASCGSHPLPDHANFSETSLFQALSCVTETPQISDFTVAVFSECRQHTLCDAKLAYELVQIQMDRQPGRSKALVEFRQVPDIKYRIAHASGIQTRLLSEKSVLRELEFVLKRNSDISKPQRKAILEVFSSLYAEGKHSSRSAAMRFALELIKKLKDLNKADPFGEHLAVWARLQQYNPRVTRMMNDLRVTVRVAREPIVKFEFKKEEQEAILNKLASATTLEAQQECFKELEAMLKRIKTASSLGDKDAIKLDIIQWTKQNEALPLSTSPHWENLPIL